MKTITIIIFTLGFVFTGIAQNKGVTRFTKNSTSGLVPIKSFNNGTSRYWAVYDATKRSSLVFVDANNHVQILSEVQPDAAYSSIAEIAGKIKVADYGTIEAVTKFAATVSQLGEKSAAVYFLRDALFRLNEKSLQYTAGPPDKNQGGTMSFGRYDSLFREILDASVEFAKYEYEAKGKAETLDAIKKMNVKADSLTVSLINIEKLKAEKLKTEDAKKKTEEEKKKIEEELEKLKAKIECCESKSGK